MKSGLVRFISVLLCFFFVIYTGWQSYRFFFPAYRTETASAFEVAQGVTTIGILIRTEEPICRDVSGKVHYLAEEGQKFVSATPLAEVYSSWEEAQAAKERTQLEKEWRLLESFRGNNTLGQRKNLEILTSDISMALLQLHQNSRYNTPKAVDELRLTLIEKITRRQLITGELSPRMLEERVAELKARAPLLPKSSKIHSAQSGYFSRFVDHQEELFSPKLLKDLDAITVQDLASREYSNDANTFGKSVTSFIWRYATVVSLDEALMFTPGREVSITFVGGNHEPLTGWVERVSEEPGQSQALVVIRSNQMSPDVVSHRVATVKLGFRSYQGIRFPKEALRIVDGQRGVYVKSGFDVQFRKVDILYTGRNFYLSRTEYNSQTHLNLFEEVIVGGLDLYDGKPL